MLGTLGNGFPGALSATANTTPDALLVHGLLAEYAQQGANTAVMEVSSHALTQGRVNGVHFDVALLTNLTRDHLDYHKDMESYFSAKEKLFTGALGSQPGASVINVDDEYGRRLFKSARGDRITYGFGNRTEVGTDHFKLSPGGRLSVTLKLSA